jgi:3-oxoacyl-[acyl-carrier protein] reductase
MNLSLQNRTAVICGSSQGIGLAAAIELSRQGATCILMARNEDSLKEALLHLESDQNQHHGYLVADFDQPETVRKAIDEYILSNPVHVLVNNSGGPSAGPIVDAMEEDFTKTFNRHLICNHILTKAVIPSMKQEGYGRIINIISTSVKVPLPNLGVSNTIRGAVASWAKTMANELGQFGITVNNVLPGATSTARLEGIISNKVSKTGASKEEVSEEMLAEIPAHRFGKPEEIAAMITFLASDAAGYVNGVSIPVDGGRTGSI